MDDKELEALIGMPVEKLEGRELKLMAMRVCYNEGMMKGKDGCHLYYSELFHSVLTPEGCLQKRT